MLTENNHQSPLKLGTRAHADWCVLWSLVASMGGMRDLEVYLIVHFDQYPQRMDLEQETNLFEPLLMVTQMRRFIVYVSWLRPRPGFEREDMRFKIVDSNSVEERDPTVS